MFGPCRRGVVAAMCVAPWLVLGAPAARAQGGPSAEELSAARSLFAEALRDEEAQRYQDALRKFQAVREVRDTSSIEYRIGTCYEGLGQAAAAYTAYRRATSVGQYDAQGSDVVGAAQVRLDALAKHVARLTLALPEHAPADAEVRVDDTPVARAALSEPIAVEPGTHVVTATATGATPFRSEIVLPEGAPVSLSISLEPPPGPIAAPVIAAPEATVAEGPGTTPGWIAAAGGGALLATSVVLFFVRQSDISKLNRDCPNAVCPPGANRGDLESTRSRALVEGPAAIVLGIAGVATTGLGAYFVLTARGGPSPSRATVTHIAPLIGWRTGGLSLAGTFR
jgi:hypothetical protein